VKVFSNSKEKNGGVDSMLDKRFVGKEYPEFTVEVEKGKIREFARAVGDKNPVYYDEEAAKKVGFEGGPVIPPTFPTVFATSGQVMNIIADLKIDMAKLLHGAQEYEYINPIKAGDTISGKTKIANIVEKSKMDVVDVETTYINQNGQTVLREKCTFLVRH